MKIPGMNWFRKGGSKKDVRPPVRRFEVSDDAALNAPVSNIGAFKYRELASDAEDAAPADTMDIWIIPAEAMIDLARSHDVLSAEEREHANQINHRLHKIRYIAVRTALRYALSRRVQNAIAGDGWKISTPPFGKPQICSEQANCNFSITHADDFSVIAVAPDTDIGIDAERIDSDKIKTLPIDCLSENEQKRLAAKSRDEQYYDFFRFWTLKEAYTKALGVGLSAEFERIEFELDAAETKKQQKKKADKGIDDEQYELLTLKYMEFEHLLAICLLGVAREKAAQTPKTLFLVESEASASRAAEEFARSAGAMNPYFQVVDASNPERIELYGLEDLPETLHQCVELHARTSPDRVALEIDGEPLTYGELNARAEAAAGYLMQNGVEPGDFVAVCQSNSADLFISLLGVMKAGGAYVPVEPEFAASRAGAIVKRHGVHIVLTSTELSGSFNLDETVHVVCVDEIDPKDIASLAASVKVTSKSMSHVAFKAGESDADYGVNVSHGDAVKFAFSLAAVYGIEPHHRCYQDRYLSFDVAVEEIWAMLCAGATVVLANEMGEAPEAFIASHGIHVISTGPETLERIESELPGVEVLIVGGRPCASQLAVKWALRTGRFVSLKRAGDRFPSFSIEQESGDAWRPRMLPPHAADKSAA